MGKYYTTTKAESLNFINYIFSFHHNFPFGTLGLAVKNTIGVEANRPFHHFLYPQQEDLEIMQIHRRL